jgi:hypothetical protein
MGNQLSTVTYTNGDVYIGKWKYGSFHGKGKYIQSTGEVREGQWIKGRFTGTGTYRRNNGDVYTGDIKDNMSHGKGKLTQITGDVYTGDFNGSFHGQGKLTQSTGEILEGLWMRDRFMGTVTYKCDNNIYDIAKLEDTVMFLKEHIQNLKKQ